LNYDALNQLIQANLPLIVGIFGVAILFLLVLCIILFVKVRRERKRYDFFMGTNRRPSHNLETKLHEYFESVKKIEENYDKLLEMVTDLDETMQCNIQKVGIIRYNPFQEMGGNLCFAVALLDGKDNGIVLNGIHSRTGSFTYAKPIELGTSIYTLSQEEKDAIQMAKENVYQPKAEKIVKVKPKKRFYHKFVREVEKNNTEKEEKIENTEEVTLVQQEEDGFLQEMETGAEKEVFSPVEEMTIKE
jgi:hypothetical protein